MLDKAILSGKEKREKYRGAKAVDRSCRNNGSCPYCRSNRMKGTKYDKLRHNHMRELTISSD